MIAPLHSDALVFFGATGDLAYKQIFPALQAFAAAQLRIDSWRCADVPFSLRAGKCLPVSAFEVRVQLERPPRDVYRERSSLPLDAALMAYVLATRFIRRNPADPGFIDRDRFVLSAGHASTLLKACR